MDLPRMHVNRIGQNGLEKNGSGIRGSTQSVIAGSRRNRMKAIPNI